VDAPFRQYLGWERFPENLTEPEVAHFFSLSEDDRRAVHRRRRPLNRLGLALRVGFLRLTGAPLNSVEMIPPQVLAHLGAELGVAPPRLASIRALYRRRRTLFEHQDAAKQALGLHDLTVHGERALNGFLRREAGDKFLVDELEQAARARPCTRARRRPRCWPKCRPRSGHCSTCRGSHFYSCVASRLQDFVALLERRLATER